MSFLSDYLLVARSGEAPPLYAKWSALAVLSALAERRVYYRCRKWAVTPSLGVLLVGAPGMHKGEAIGMARELLVAVRKRCGAATGYEKLADDSTSAGQLLKDMVRVQEILERDGEHVPQTGLAIFNDEFKQFCLKHDPLTMLQFLASVHDAEHHSESTKTGGKAGKDGEVTGTKDEIWGVALTLLVGIQPDEMVDDFGNLLVRGGLSRRLVSVYAAQHPLNTSPEEDLSPEAAAAWNRCVEVGVRIARDRSLRGRLRMTRDAASWYNEAWRPSVGQQWTENVGGMQYWFSSKHMQLVKVGLLLALAAGERELTLETLQTALVCLKEAEALMGLVYERVGLDPIHGISVELLEYLLQRDDWVAEAELRQRFGARAASRRMTDVLEHLHKQEKVALAYRDKSPWWIARSVLDAKLARETASAEGAEPPDDSEID